MLQKDKQVDESSENKASQGNEQPLSETIANAHAAGDGALERGKDTLMASEDASEDEKKEPTGKEAY